MQRELVRDPAPDPLAHRAVADTAPRSAAPRRGRPSRTPSRRSRAAPRRTASRAPSRAAARRPCDEHAARSAVPSPNHAGRMIRACVQENTHGIARKSSIARDARRLARARAELQPGDLVERRRLVEEGVQISVAVDELAVRVARTRAPSRPSRRRTARAARPRRPLPPSSVETSTALPVSSSSRWAISGTEYFAESTSPCSVIFMRPATVPGGWAWMATLAGPPPRPTAPPRPWKNTHETPSGGQRLGDLGLRAVGRPAGRDVARRPCWSPSSRSSPPARRRPPAARRGTTAPRAARAACRRPPASVALGLEQRHDPQLGALAAGARRARSPSSAAAPRAGRRGTRSRSR